MGSLCQPGVIWRSDQVIYSFMITSGAKDMFDENCDVTFNTPERSGRLRSIRNC